MSNLSAALAAALQNDNNIGPLISGTISGRNFELQDELLATSPYACIAVTDLPTIQRPYVGTSQSGNTRIAGQVEVRIISKSSETDAKNIADWLVGDNRNRVGNGILWRTTSLPYDGSNIAFGMTNCMQQPDVDETLTTWLEILTIDYRS